MLPEAWHEFAAAAAQAATPTAASGTASRVIEASMDEGATSQEEVEDSVLRWYAAALASDDAALRAQAAGSWSRWEMRIFSLCGRLPPCPPPFLEARTDHANLIPGDADPWIWDPENRRWTAGEHQLSSIDVEAQLITDFEERVRSSLASQLASKVPGSAVASAATSAAGNVVSGVSNAVRQSGAALANAPAAIASATGIVRPSGTVEPSSSTNATGANSAAGGGWVPAQARLTSHYSVERAFLSEGELLRNAAAGGFRGIPCVAVHGANDLICPPTTAYALHQAWPEMELRIIPGGGHSMYDVGLRAEVIRATDRFRALSPRNRTTSPDAR